jgi:nucleotide-binding universal stress UspA family protein
MSADPSVTVSKRVVVGYDGSAGSVAAVEWAAEQASARGLPLEVRHVVEPVTALGLDALGPAWVEGAQATADRAADEGAGIARRLARVPVTARGVVGHPTAGLLQDSESVVLLVVGAHGEGELPAVLVGSVAFAVTVHARCPVAVVRGAPPPRPGVGRPVVVGVDGSRSATAALLEAADLADRSGAELVVVCVWRPTVSTRWGGDWDAASPARRSSQAHRVAADAVVRVEADRARHVHPELSVSTRVLEGPPARVLADISSAAGTLVVGSRGRGGFAGLLLGSITRRLVHDAACPVLVVRRVADASAALGQPSGTASTEGT